MTILQMKANLCFIPCWILLLACSAARPSLAQDESPLTRLFDTGDPSAQPWAEEAVANRVGWTLVPEDNLDHTFKGDAVLLNDKLAVVIRKLAPEAEVYAKAANGLRNRASLDRGDARLRVADSLASLKIIENTASAVMLETTLKGPRPAALRLRLTTGESLLEIRSGAEATSVRVATKARYVVVPDYFGDDMVYDMETTLGSLISSSGGEGVSGGQGSDNLCLPAENFCLNLLDGGEAMVMTVWQSNQQEVRLGRANTGQEKGFCSTAIQGAKDKNIWLAFFESPALWHAGQLPAKSGWQAPFPAKWRGNLVAGNGLADSWTSDQPDPAVLPSYLAPRDKKEGLLLFYPIDRTTATPLTVTCPTDVMRNTLGVGPCQYILACEGMAAQGDPTPNSVMTWVEKQFEQKKEKKSADEIKERLEVMTKHVAEARTRIERYVAFGSEVRKLVTNKSGSEPFRSILDDLDRVIAPGLTPTASGPQAEKLAAEVSALIGKADTLATCQRLGGQLRSMGALQDSTLAKGRMSVRRLHAQALTMLAEPPPQAPLAPEVLRLADDMLSKK